jgi:hypothetical protein
MSDAEQPPELAPRVIVAGYLIALVCVIVPAAVVGALFASAALFTRRRRAAAAGVLVVGIACTAAGVALA